MSERPQAPVVWPLSCCHLARKAGVTAGPLPHPMPEELDSLRPRPPDSSRCWEMRRLSGGLSIPWGRSCGGGPGLLSTRIRGDPLRKRPARMFATALVTNRPHEPDQDQDGDKTGRDPVRGPERFHFVVTSVVDIPRQQNAERDRRQREIHQPEEPLFPKPGNFVVTAIAGERRGVGGSTHQRLSGPNSLTFVVA